METSLERIERDTFKTVSYLKREFVVTKYFDILFEINSKVKT